MSSPDFDNLLDSIHFNQSIVEALGLDPRQLPLQENIIYRGNDFQNASAAVSSISGLRSFRAQTNTPAPYIEIRRARLRYSEIGLTFNNVETRMRTPGRVDYYSLAIPLSGHQVSMTDAGEVTTRSPQARVHSAGSVYDITRSANYVAIIVGLSVAGFERFVGDKIDVLIGPDSSFSLVLDLTDKRFNVFTSILGTLLKALGERVDDSPQSDIVITRLEDALWFSFADACPELYREYRETRRPGPKSGAVNRVTVYIHDNVERELTLSELVRVSGMSARTLHSGFRDAYGTGPMAYVKRLRLNRCRKELLAASPEEEFVGDIAASWGFYHLSSFARYYREEFGELPSESLRRGGHAFRRGAHNKS